MPNAEFIAFRIGEQEFCIDIMSVREIRGWSAATPLPHAPPYIRGVINLRGSVLPIVDLAERLNLPQAADSQRRVIIVVQAGARIIGLVVDGVSEILAYAPESIQPTPDMAPESVKSVLRGVLVLDGRMIGLIRLEGVLPPLEEAA